MVICWFVRLIIQEPMVSGMRFFLDVPTRYSHYVLLDQAWPDCFLVQVSLRHDLFGFSFLAELLPISGLDYCVQTTRN